MTTFSEKCFEVVHNFMFIHKNLPLSLDLWPNKFDRSHRSFDEKDHQAAPQSAIFMQC